MITILKITVVSYDPTIGYVVVSLIFDVMNMIMSLVFWLNLNTSILS